MLLVEATINGTTYYTSMEGIVLTHYWDAHIVNFDPPQYQISNPYGGYVRPGFGSISFSHDLFSSEWPPPANVILSAYYTATDEASKELIITTMAHLSSIDREAIRYELFSPSYTTTVSDLTAFDDTLVNVVTWFCNAARLNLTLNSTYARAVSPDVKFTVSGDQIAINLLSDICAFFTHLFYISDGTLYLIDMLLDAGSETITEFDFFPSEYAYEVPVAIARTANYSSTSAYPYGQEISLATEFIDTEAKVTAALDNIITVRNLARCNLSLPFIGDIPTPGKKISWADTSLGNNTNAYIRTRTIIYDFNNEEVVIEGEGTLTIGADEITILSVIYWTALSGTLTVAARSTNQSTVTLTLVGYGELAWNATDEYYVETFYGVSETIPAVLTVTSDYGGTVAYSLNTVRDSLLFAAVSGQDFLYPYTQNLIEEGDELGVDLDNSVLQWFNGATAYLRDEADNAIAVAGDPIALSDVFDLDAVLTADAAAGNELRIRRE